MGSGKTALADEIAVQLYEQGLSHALLDLDWLCQAYPAPADDPYRDELMLKNLGAIWPNYRDQGVRFLVLARVVEHRDHSLRYKELIPEANIQVVRVTAPPELVEERLEKREIGSFYDHLWCRSQELAPVLEAAGVEDFVVVNDGRPVRQVAEETMSTLGWPAPSDR